MTLEMSLLFDLKYMKLIRFPTVPIKKHRQKIDPYIISAALLKDCSVTVVFTILLKIRQFIITSKIKVGRVNNVTITNLGRHQSSVHLPHIKRLHAGERSKSIVIVIIGSTIFFFPYKHREF